MSSKGQIVIPLDLREGMKEGEKILVIRNGDQLILKKADAFSKNIAADLEFAKKTEESWKRYEKGEFITKSGEEFLSELAKL